MDSQRCPERDPASISSWYRPTSGSVAELGAAAGGARKIVFTDRADGPGAGAGGAETAAVGAAGLLAGGRSQAQIVTAAVAMPKNPDNLVISRSPELYTNEARRATSFHLITIESGGGRGPRGRPPPLR